jgi:hypothetical protein
MFSIFRIPVASMHFINMLWRYAVRRIILLLSSVISQVYLWGVRELRSGGDCCMTTCLYSDALQDVDDANIE